MKDLITIRKKDETWYEIDGPTHFCKALSDHFTFEVENLHHIRRQTPRLKYWDGKIRLFKVKTGLLPYGLIHEAIEWMASNNQVQVVVEGTNRPPFSFRPELYDILVKQAQKNNPKFDKAPHQEEAIKHCLQKRHAILVSPTSSGKSFIIFAIQQHIMQKTLIIVPTVQLTHQMEKDFFSYGFTGNLHKLYYDQDRSFSIENGDVVVGTWQTLRKMPDEFFEQFDLLIGDEVHELQTNSGQQIIEACKNAWYKIGTTGSLKNSKMHRLALEGLFGPVFQCITTKELMDVGFASKLKIKIIVLKYNEQDCKEFWQQCGRDSKAQLEWLFKHEKRKEAICKLALSLPRNTLIMFRRSKYGLDLYQTLEVLSQGTKRLFYVDYEVDTESRKDLVDYFEKNDDGTGVVSFGTFQRGISINNLHNLIYATPNKSEITTVQSIGRTIRLHEEKEFAILWDFADDLTYRGETNTALDHLYARLHEYISADFEYEIRTIHI